MRVHDLFIAKEWYGASLLWINISWWTFYIHFMLCITQSLLCFKRRFYIEWVHICFSLLTAIYSSAVRWDLTLRGIYWFSINGSWRLFFLCIFHTFFFIYFKEFFFTLFSTSMNLFKDFFFFLLSSTPIWKIQKIFFMCTFHLFLTFSISSDDFFPIFYYFTLSWLNTKTEKIFCVALALHFFYQILFSSLFFENNLNNPSRLIELDSHWKLRLNTMEFRWELSDFMSIWLEYIWDISWRKKMASAHTKVMF